MFVKINTRDISFIPATGRRIAEMISADKTKAETVTCRVVEIYPETEGGEREPHAHLEMEEVIFVLEGKGKVLIQDHEEEIAENDVLIIPMKTMHRIVNPGGTLRLLCFFPKSNVGIP